MLGLHSFQYALCSDTCSCGEGMTKRINLNRASAGEANQKEVECPLLVRDKMRRSAVATKKAKDAGLD